MTPPLQMSAPEADGRRALVLAIMALVFAFLLPAAGLALSVFGIVIAIRDLRVLAAARRRVGMATSAIVISCVAFLLGAASTALQLYFSAELTAFTECRKGAGTVQAQSECTEQLTRSLEKKLGVTLPEGFPALG